MRTPPLTASALLTTDEVGKALNLPVSQADTSMAGPVRIVRFSTERRAVLVLQLAQGPAGLFAWRTNEHGAPLAGIGEGAWINGDRAGTRSGDTTVLLTLVQQGKGHRSALPQLLTLVASRLPAPAPSPDPPFASIRQHYPSPVDHGN